MSNKFCVARDINGLRLGLTIQGQPKAISLETWDFPGELGWANTPGYANADPYGTALCGKPLHLVDEDRGQTLCGIKRTSWSVDIANADTCARCTQAAVKLGLIILRDPDEDYKFREG